MGYQSYFDIRIRKHPDETIEENYQFGDIIDAMEEQSGYNFEHSGNCRLNLMRAKWYDEQKDMKEVSKQFPELIFEIRRDGEESEDFTVSYYYNGEEETHSADIVYPNFSDEEPDTYTITLTSIKDPEVHHLLKDNLDVSYKLLDKYLDVGEYMDLELEVDSEMNIVEAKFLEQ